MPTRRTTTAAATVLVAGVGGTAGINAVWQAISNLDARVTALESYHAPPPPAYGACCYPDDQCGLATEEWCLGHDGEYLGDDTNCDGDPCAPPPDPTGACCDGDFCYEVTEAECVDVHSGVYLGDGTTCAGNPCLEEPPDPGDWTVVEGFVGQIMLDRASQSMDGFIYRDCTFTGDYGFMVKLNSGVVLKNGRFENCDFHAYGGQGCYAFGFFGAGMENIEFHGCTFTHHTGAETACRAYKQKDCGYRDGTFNQVGDKVACRALQSNGPVEWTGCTFNGAGLHFSQGGDEDQFWSDMLIDGCTFYNRSTRNRSINGDHPDRPSGMITVRDTDFPEDHWGKPLWPPAYHHYRDGGGNTHRGVPVVVTEM